MRVTTPTWIVWRFETEEECRAHLDAIAAAGIVVPESPAVVTDSATTAKRWIEDREWSAFLDNQGEGA